MKLTNSLIYIFLFIIAVVTLFPFIWMFFTSFKAEADILAYPPSLIPRTFSLRSYLEIWNSIPFFRLFVNTVIFSVGVTFISVILDSMAAYAFARIDFPFKNILFIIVLVTLMIPFQVILIPLFKLLYELNWLNTYMGLIIPRASSAFGIFLLRQFFVKIPYALEDAARIDGCSEFTIFRKIIMPLSKPALATIAIFHFMYNWNDFLWPMVITNSMSMRTLPVGLALFRGEHVIEYGMLTAGAVLALLPIVLVYLYAQKYFVQGIALTGLKG